MALLTYSASSKDTEITVTLNLVDLEVISKISSSYLSSKNNWTSITVNLSNPTNFQKVSLPFFNAGGNSLQRTMLLDSLYQGNDLQIDSVIVHDKYSGYVRLERSDIPSVSSYDLNLAGGSFDGVSFSQTLKPAPLTLSNDDYTVTNNETASSTLYTNYVDNAGLAIAGGGKYYLELSMDNMGLNTNFGGTSVNGIGFYRGTALPSNFATSVVFESNSSNMYVAANTPKIVRNGNEIGSNAFTSIAQGDILGLAIDLDTSTVKFMKNGTWYSVGGNSTDFNAVNGDGFLGSGDNIFAGAISTAGGSIITKVKNPTYTPAGYTVI